MFFSKIRYIMQFRIGPTHLSTSIMTKPPLTSCQSDTNQLIPAAAHLEVERGLSLLLALQRWRPLVPAGAQLEMSFQVTNSPGQHAN